MADKEQQSPRQARVEALIEQGALPRARDGEWGRAAD